MVREGIKLDVGDNARLDFDMKIGDSQTVVTVHGGPPLMNTENASVGTVIDRDTIDQMPLNGRGIQTLVELTPGVVAVPVVDASPGQFVVNGQRNDANYFTVDGVSANFAVLGSLIPNAVNVIATNQQGSSQLPANNFLGTFSNLVSPDALQEFQIQTSTFAPEFGHFPGAQIGMITRSGTNRYSGSLFEYLRNDRMDASDWFANQLAAPKPPLRFNDFGGTLGGPVRIPRIYNGHDRTFFFLSVESLVAIQPQPPMTYPVPTQAARQNAPPAFAELLNAWPLPNRPYGPEGDPAVSGVGAFAGAYSLRQNQQSYGLRVDQTLSDKLTFFARYDQSPAEAIVPAGTIPSNIQHDSIGTQTLTLGLTHIVGPHLVNEIRLNGSRQVATVISTVNRLGGAQQPPDSLFFPSGFTSSDSQVIFNVDPFPAVTIGFDLGDTARQLQAVDNLSLSTGAHQFKFGADYRWFSPAQTEPRLLSDFSTASSYGPTGFSGGPLSLDTGHLCCHSAVCLRHDGFFCLCAGCLEGKSTTYPDVRIALGSRSVSEGERRPGGERNSNRAPEPRAAGYSAFSDVMVESGATVGVCLADT